MDYARRYLGVKRLPAGVPAEINAYVNSLTGWPEQGHTLVAILRPYYRRPLTL